MILGYNQIFKTLFGSRQVVTPTGQRQVSQMEACFACMEEKKFRRRISTEPLEGLNNKIKVLERMAQGYLDQEYFKLRLFHLHLEAHAVS